MKLAIALILIAIVLWYALAGRKWLKTKPWAVRFFAWIEPVEIALYHKSETVLAGRFLGWGSALVTTYDGFAAYASSLDLTPIQTRVFDALSIPQDLRPLAVGALISGIGFAVVKLRKSITKPLEVVAVADKDVTPEVAQAVMQAEVSNAVAVATVKAAN